MRKIALITGIITQDGSYLADFLLEKGYEVHGLISSKAQLKSDRLTHLVSNEEIMNKQLFFHLGDMTDTSSLNRLLENIRPDEIYNLASQSHVYVSFEMPEYTAQVNSLGTLRLLDAIKQSDLRTRLFNESTSQIFGSCLDGEIQNENSPINPENPYATSKAYAHFIVKNYRKNYGLYAVNGIMFNRTSPREDEDFIAKKITKTIANIKLGKEKKLIVGNIDSKRDWGYSPDYIEGMWLSLQQDNPDDYIFATGETHSVKELIELSFKEIGISIKWQGEGLDTKGINALNGDLLVEISPELYRIDTRFSCGDSSLTKEKINWEHKVKFNKLVKLMIQDELNK